MRYYRRKPTKDMLSLMHVWRGMIASGVAMCPEWQSRYSAFREWAMANGWRPELVLCRIDSRKGYEPSNCRWASGDPQLNLFREDDGHA